MHCIKKFLKISLVLMLTVGIAFFSCSCGIESSATTLATTIADTLLVVEDAIVDEYMFSEDGCEDLLLCALSTENRYINCDVIKYYSQFLDETYSSAVVTRAEWLGQLLNKLDYEIVTDNNSDYTHFSDINFSDYTDYFITALENGIVEKDSNATSFGPYCAVTRQYLSTSLVNAAGYTEEYKLSCDDYREIDDKAQVATVIYLGYLELDENNCFDPYGMVTDEQVEYILSELDILKELKDKTVMSFGDSIMHGDGNNYTGIAELLEDKYLMTAVDYSMGGSTFGKVCDREQICAQISNAIENNETADIILVNGGTNDMRKVSPGAISDGYEYQNLEINDFCPGMEYAMGLFKDNYPDTPVLYVRAHDMVYGIERNELHFGKLALDICEKWDIEVADIFSDTDFDCHDDYLKSAYTAHTDSRPNGDTIHPNKLGYYRFYLPLISEKTIELLNN